MTESFEQVAREIIAARVSAATRASYGSVLGDWLRYCREARVDASSPTLAQATAYRDALLGEHKRAPLTVRHVMSVLSSLYRRTHALQRGGVSWNPFDPDVLSRPPETRGKTDAIDPKVAEAVIAAAQADPSPRGRRDAALLLLWYTTGLRRTSVGTLRRDKVSDRQGGMRIRVINKGGKEIVCEVPEVAAEALRAWLAEAPRSAWVFPSERTENRRPLHPTTLNSIVTSRAAEARLRDPRLPHVHPHQFRAAFVTEALDAGIPLPDVQAMVGHASPRTTQSYDRGKRGAGVADRVAAHRAGRKK